MLKSETESDILDDKLDPKQMDTQFYGKPELFDLKTYERFKSEYSENFDFENVDFYSSKETRQIRQLKKNFTKDEITRLKKESYNIKCFNCGTLEGVKD